MIEYTLRLLGSSVLSLGRSKLDLFDESVVDMRVWPSDLDPFGHMNNGRYLTVMDLGRNDLLVRAGAASGWLKRRWSPLLGGATIRYTRSLRPFRRYQLRTRILGWDDKWFYIGQRFTCGEQLCATAMIKGLLMGPEGKVPPADIPAAIGKSRTSPPLPEAVRRWSEAESSMLEAWGP